MDAGDPILFDTPAVNKNRIAIVCDGSKWFVRRIRVIEHDLEHDEMVYRCDKPLGNDYKSLAVVPQVARLLKRRQNK